VLSEQVRQVAPQIQVKRKIAARPMQGSSRGCSSSTQRAPSYGREEDDEEKGVLTYPGRFRWLRAPELESAVVRVGKERGESEEEERLGPGGTNPAQLSTD
jgi:hypothetical protein